jgi:hypothetical protein
MSAPEATAESEWREYKPPTLTKRGEKVCVGCGARTTRPYVEGWRWRLKDMKGSGRTGRFGESWCGKCVAPSAEPSRADVTTGGA